MLLKEWGTAWLGMRDFRFQENGINFLETFQEVRHEEMKLNSSWLMLAIKQRLMLIIQMSTDKTNLLSYLPPQQRQRVISLIQRLQEETQAKNKLQSLYNHTKNELNELMLKYNKLKDENAYLKQQMHNSFSMISQVRANFQASKEKQQKKKEVNGDWEDQSESEDENQPNTNNKTIINLHPPKPNNKSSLEKYRPAPPSADKSNHVLNISSSFLNQTSFNSATKNRELEDLRKEVQALQLEKQRQEQKAKELTQKHRLVDQIKHRYRSQQGESSSKGKERSIERIDITDTFEQEQPQIKVKSTAKKPKMPQVQTKPAKQAIKPAPKQPPSQHSKKHVHIQQDYGDVLDLINDYNL